MAASVLPVQRSSREAPNARPSGGRRDPTPSLPLCLLLRTGDERRGAARRRTRAGGGGRNPAPSLPLRLLLCAGEERGGAEVGSGQQWRQRSSIFLNNGGKSVKVRRRRMDPHVFVAPPLLWKPFWASGAAPMMELLHLHPFGRS